MTDQFHRLCSVCDQPMVDGQAFNGLKKAHWDCAPGEKRAVRSSLAAESPAPAETKLDVPTVGDKRQPARAPEKGPTSENIRLASQFPDARQVESRTWAETWRSAVNGKSSIGLECPFCFEVIQAFVWSLPNGKRCPCGALHGRNDSKHWVEAKSA